MDKITPLYDTHKALGAKFISYAGWLLPERYGAGLIEEHMAVRRRAGVFDVSHMGEVFIKGDDTIENLQYLLTNDFSKMEEGQVRYSVMCDESGGILDDMLVYKVYDDCFMIVLNAANTDSDVEWMKDRLKGDAELWDASEETSQFAVQGPEAMSVAKKLKINIPSRFHTAYHTEMVADIPCVISRSGYTGEDGFELYCGSEYTDIVWDVLFDAFGGGNDGIIMCGLGARDTLRLEAALPLYGHEMDRSITPLEAGLKFAVKFNKPDFIGKSALLAAGEPKRKRVGLKITGRGIARENYPVISGDTVIGRVTSGTYCPYLGYAAAMALVSTDADAGPGARVEVDIRGKLTQAEIVPLPFYRRA